jgi:hypothetical protein
MEEENLMSLLDDVMETFVFMVKEIVKDGYGGYTQEWTEGVDFKAAAVLDSSIQARIGEVQGLTSLYTITVSREIPLEFHDVIKRKSDGKVFRLTSDGDDKKTPPSAGLDMRQASAEEWRLPS